MSTKVIKIIEISGLFVTNHKINAKAAANKLNLSEKVIFFSPLFNARKNITKQNIAVKAVTQAPAPPLPKSCPKKQFQLKPPNQAKSKHEVLFSQKRCP